MSEQINYKIVELSVDSWAIQYNNGLIVSGYKSFDSAMEYAQANPYNYNNGVILPPVTMEEALLGVQSAQDDYRTFLKNNPSASSEEKLQKQNQIYKAEEEVSDYQRRLQEQSNGSYTAASNKSIVNEINNSTLNGTFKGGPNKSVIDEINAYTLSGAGSKQYYVEQTNLETLDSLRKQKSEEAANIRKNPNATPNQINDADEAAFRSESMYSDYKNQITNTKTLGVTESPDTLLSPNGTPNNFSAISSTDQLNSSDINGTSGSNPSTDIVKTNIDNNFGNISLGTRLDGSKTSSFGYLQNGSTTVYSTNTGVTRVNNSVDQRVKISPKPGIRDKILTGVLEPLKETGGLVFPYTPNIQVAGSANYSTLDPTHANNNWYIYNNTPSIDVQITGLFTSQNEIEAKYTLACIHFLRVLTKMHFGDSDENKGLPPPQVLLDGYGTYMFNGLSVILKNYNMDLQDSVDYVTVNSGNGISRIPVMMNLSVQLTIQQTPLKSRTFNWDNFADGSLMQQKGWL